MIKIKKEEKLSKPVRKVLSVISYTVMVAFVFLLIKTEARKWLVMEGEATPANSVIWWISLGFSLLFGYLGLVLSPNDDKSKDHKVNKLVNK